MNANQPAKYHIIAVNVLQTMRYSIYKQKSTHLFT